MRDRAGWVLIAVAFVLAALTLAWILTQGPGGHLTPGS